MAYGHHLPKMHNVMLEPDLLDTDPNTIVVLAVDKETGQPVGTARSQTNAGAQLLIEHSISIPEWMCSDTRSEVSRLSTVPGADPLVKLALMKASYLFCLAAQVRWMVICARSDSLVRQYRHLGFDNLFGDQSTRPMLHVGRIEHHVLAFNVHTAEARWRESGKPLYGFMVDTFHRDIDLFASTPAMGRSGEESRVSSVLKRPSTRPATAPAPSAETVEML